MQRIFVLSFMLAATAPAAALATSWNAPSGAPAPLSAPLPATPEACAGAPTVSGEDLRFVTLFSVIDWEGRATQVEVENPSDDCLKPRLVFLIHGGPGPSPQRGAKSCKRNDEQSSAVS